MFLHVLVLTKPSSGSL